MKASELFEQLKGSGVVPEAIEAAEQIWRDRVDAFLASTPPSPPTESKSVKDAVWGMIELRPAEVLLVDSPPLQRLRQVRQLGLGYLTYPTAGYSRFEHTLGAVHQAERILRAVAQRSAKGYRTEIIDTLTVVRLAALVHDIGHLPLSHVSERFYTWTESESEVVRDAQALRADIGEALGVSKVKLSECLSIVLVATPSMGEVFARAGYDPEEVAKAALAIAGRSWEEREFFVIQLISNVVDADKLDYMFRDGFVTRVPLAVDLERLLYKLKIVSVPARRLPAGKRGHIRHDAEALVLGTDVAGDRLAYEVSQARSMLFERVYFHHKTRAAERIALRGLAELDLPAVKLLGYGDDLFGGFGKASFPAAMAPVASRLEDRRLPRRAFAISTAFARAQGLETLWREDQNDDFSDDYLEELVEADRRDAQGADQLAKRSIDRVLRDSGSRDRLREAIAAKFAALAEILELPPDLEGIWVDTPALPPGPGEPALYIVSPDGEVSTDQGYAPIAAAETYEPLHIAFVYADADPARRALVHVACEFALQDEADLVFDRNAADFAKVSWEEIQDRKRALEAREPKVFASHGHLRPESRAAHDAELADRIDAQAMRFRSYSSDTPVQISSERIRSYLDQFPEHLVAPMLAVLERLTFLDRNRFAGFAAHLATLVAEEGTVFVPLTSVPGKSADHLPYFFADQSDDLEIHPLVQALELARPLIVFDDLLLSGTQSEKVVRTWFGQRRHRSSIVLDASQRNALSENLRALSFCWAWSPGVELLESVLEDRKLDAAVDAMHSEDESPGLDGIEREEELRAFLAEVGREVLLSTRGKQPTKPWSKERCESNALGYGNSERLVITEYNAPAGTITALWKHGGFRGAKWLPLFPRRRS